MLSFDLISKSENTISLAKLKYALVGTILTELCNSTLVFLKEYGEKSIFKEGKSSKFIFSKGFELKALI